MQRAQTRKAALLVLALLVSLVLERRALAHQAMQPQVLEQLQYASTSTSAPTARTTATLMGCVKTRKAALLVLALLVSSVQRAFVRRVIRLRTIQDMPNALTLMSAAREPTIVCPQKFAKIRPVDFPVDVQGQVLKEMHVPAQQQCGEIQLRLLVLIGELVHQM
jgi:hypothetical protein